MAKAKQQSGGPFIGPKGGKWADAAHTIPWDEKKHGAKAKDKKPQPPDPRGPGAAPYKSRFKRYAAGQMGIPRANALDAMPEGSTVQIHGGSSWRKKGRNWVEHQSATRTRMGDGADIHADLYAYGGAVKDASKDMNKAEKIPGGLADGKSPAKYDQAQLQQGIKVEMEHTDDPAKAREIAMDHLEEDPRYYAHLAAMEAEHAKKGCDTPGEKKRSGGRGRGAAVGAGEGPINRRGDAEKSMGGLGLLEDYLEKAKKPDPRQLGLFGGGAPKAKAVVRIGKRGGKIVGEDSKGNPIYEGSAAAKKLQSKAGGKGKPRPAGMATPDSHAAYKKVMQDGLDIAKDGDAWAEEGTEKGHSEAWRNYQAAADKFHHAARVAPTEQQKKVALDHAKKFEGLRAEHEKLEATAHDRERVQDVSKEERDKLQYEMSQLESSPEKAHAAAKKLVSLVETYPKKYGWMQPYLPDMRKIAGGASLADLDWDKGASQPKPKGKSKDQQLAALKTGETLNMNWVGHGSMIVAKRADGQYDARNEQGIMFGPYRISEIRKRVEGKVNPQDDFDANRARDAKATVEQVELHPRAMASVQALIGRHYPDKGAQGLADAIGMKAFEALARVVNSKANREHPSRGDVRTALKALKRKKESITARAQSTAGPKMHDEFGDLVKVLSSMSRDRKVRKSMDAIDQLGEFAKGGGPFIGPRGGKWADAQHTIPWGEDKAPKRAAGAAGGGKGKDGGDGGKGGGAEGVKDAKSARAYVKSKLSAKVDEIAGSFKNLDLSDRGVVVNAFGQMFGMVSRLANSQELGGAQGYLKDFNDKRLETIIGEVMREKQPKFLAAMNQHKISKRVWKSIQEDTMNVFEALGTFAETGDLAKAEDTPKMPEGGPHKLGEGAEQGRDLSGAGKPTGSVPMVSDNRQGVPKAKREKLSEDDEDEEKQMTDHRKPIENPKEVEAAKSLEPLAHARVMTPSVIRDTVAKERAEKVSALRKGEEPIYVPTGAPRPSQAPQEQPQGTVLRKGILVTDDSADREIEEMLKSESFYTGGAPSLTAVVPLVQSKDRCPQCNAIMAKSLTACPECGHGTVQHRFVPGGPAKHSIDSGMAENNNLHLRSPGLRRPKRQVVYIPDSE